MKKNIALVGLVLVIGLVLFGCTSSAPASSQTTGTTTPVQNSTQNQSVNIIVNQQQNQTVAQNQTQMDQGQANQTALPEDIPEYVYDPSQPMNVYFLNLGGVGLQGNAALLEKGDFTMLIDAGPIQNSSYVIDFLRAHDISTINVFVSTSQDPRNYGGITDIANNFPIQVVWTGDKTDPNYTAVINSVEDMDQQNISVQNGYSTDYDGIRFSVLNPQLQRFNDINNDAVVLRIDDGAFSMLMTSNIQSGAQGELLNTQLDQMKVDVMTAPYYGTGAGTSGSNLFLTQTMPKDMIITGSADDSASNGGSRAPFLRQLTQYGINAYETYNLGDLVVSTDGTNYNILPVNTTN